MNINTFWPPYLFARLRQAAYWHRNPRQPWMNRNAVLALMGILKPSDQCLEWGSGRSTLWFAGRTSRVVSIESNREWHEIVSRQIENRGVSERVDYRFIDCGFDDRGYSPEDHEYFVVADSFPEDFFDVVVVDGLLRAQCFRRAIRCVKPGGVIVLDNADRFFSNTFESGSSSIFEKRSLPPAGLWTALEEEILPSWRWIHTTDGICETRFLFKPV